MQDSTDKQQSAPPSRPGGQDSERRTIQSERLKAIMKELDRPLDNEVWTSTPHAGDSRETAAFLRRIRHHRDHRAALKRARKAAATVYKVKPKRSTRRNASLMMGAGAMGLAAFTSPVHIAKTSSSAQTNHSTIEDDDLRKPASLIKASEEFKQALIEEEGVRYTVYRDVAGYPTVGVGHLVRPVDKLRVGDRISEQRVLSFLEDDLKTAEQGVRILVGDLPLRQHEFDALLDLVYNVGLGNVSERESPRLNAAIQARDYDAIADELGYTFAAGRVARGLEYRSERRAQIFADASYGDPRETGSGSVT